ncbi:hypothetical protein GCM10009127_24240 [Alteraurantiacibacter aestuarii]|uniref:ABA4-like family protein n=1 Tax=Alteraurantiacibacter aestuarii TaxID=650004 RepID=UPI0031D9B4AF
MNWNVAFTFVSWLAMLAWLALIVLPRGEIVKTLIFYCGIGLLCFVYSLLFLLVISNTLDPHAVQGAGAAGFTSVEGVRNIFMSDGGAVIGWTHYLAFDLFVGLWIARDADAKGFSRLLQAPVLLVTFLAGPLGLLIWLFVREPAARRNAKAAKAARKQAKNQAANQGKNP